jgi:nucleotide-binding universal stress UspA family protein
MVRPYGPRRQGRWSIVGTAPPGPSPLARQALLTYGHVQIRVDVTPSTPEEEAVMFQRIVVPVDGSDFSWRAIGPARALSARWDTPIVVVEVVSLPDDRGLAEQYLHERLGALDIGDDDVTVEVVTMGDDIPSTIANYVDTTDGGLVVMSSVGRGRTAAVIGSVAEELLGALFGPVVVVGPHSWTERGDLARPLIVTVDGSDTSEAALPLAAAWGIGLGARPWVVSVTDPDDRDSGDVSASAYPARLAHHLAADSHHPVEFEVLHHEHPAIAVSDYARDVDAVMIVCSTHGRTGFRRIAAGSVAMGIVRHAPCPVVLYRPPHLSA